MRLVNGSGEGRNYLAVNGYNGSYVYKWDGKKWVYQVMADFNDPNEDPNDLSKKIRPDGVTALSGVIDGVSAMYGEDALAPSTSRWMTQPLPLTPRAARLKMTR